MQGIKCKLGIHKWSIWEITDRGRLHTEDNNFVGDFIIQQRYCKFSGLSKIKRVNT